MQFRFIKRHWVLSLVVLATPILALLHRPILRGFASSLIVNDSIESCDTLFVVSGDRNYAVAAELFSRHKIRQIALLQDPIRPLVQSQILAPAHERTRREIIKRGVPGQAIFIAPGETWNIWDIADRVREQLIAHPQERIAVMADQFQTKRLRSALKRTLTDQELSQIQILAVRDRRFDESNWWRSRVGIKEVVNAYVLRIHTALMGRPEPFVAPDWGCGEGVRFQVSGVSGEK